MHSSDTIPNNRNIYCGRTSTHTYAHTYTYRHTDTHRHTDTQTHTDSHTHTHTHTHAHIHTHTAQVDYIPVLNLVISRRL